MADKNFKVKISDADAFTKLQELVDWEGGKPVVNVNQDLKFKNGDIFTLDDGVIHATLKSGGANVDVYYVSKGPHKGKFIKAIDVIPA